MTNTIPMTTAVAVTEDTKAPEVMAVIVDMALVVTAVIVDMG